jgi:hypothetical protein
MSKLSSGTSPSSTQSALLRTCVQDGPIMGRESLPYNLKKPGLKEIAWPLRGGNPSLLCREATWDQATTSEASTATATVRSG